MDASKKDQKKTSTKGSAKKSPKAASTNKESGPQNAPPKLSQNKKKRDKRKKSSSPSPNKKKRTKGSKSGSGTSRSSISPMRSTPQQRQQKGQKDGVSTENSPSQPTPQGNAAAEAEPATAIPVALLSPAPSANNSARQTGKKSAPPSSGDGGSGKTSLAKKISSVEVEMPEHVVIKTTSPATPKPMPEKPTEKDKDKDKIKNLETRYGIADEAKFWQTATCPLIPPSEDAKSKRGKETPDGKKEGQKKKKSKESGGKEDKKLERRQECVRVMFTDKDLVQHLKTELGEAKNKQLAIALSRDPPLSRSDTELAQKAVDLCAAYVCRTLPHDDKYSRKKMKCAERIYQAVFSSRKVVPQMWNLHADSSSGALRNSGSKNSKTSSSNPQKKRKKRKKIFKENGSHSNESASTESSQEKAVVTRLVTGLYKLLRSPMSWLISITTILSAACHLNFTTPLKWWNNFMDWIENICLLIYCVVAAICEFAWEYLVDWSAHRTFEEYEKEYPRPKKKIPLVPQENTTGFLDGLREFRRRVSNFSLRSMTAPVRPSPTSTSPSMFSIKPGSIPCDPFTEVDGEFSMLDSNRQLYGTKPKPTLQKQVQQEPAKTPGPLPKENATKGVEDKKSASSKKPKKERKKKRSKSKEKTSVKSGEKSKSKKGSNEKIQSKSGKSQAKDRRTSVVEPSRGNIPKRNSYFGRDHHSPSGFDFIAAAQGLKFRNRVPIKVPKAPNQAP